MSDLVALKVSVLVFKPSGKMYSEEVITVSIEKEHFFHTRPDGTEEFQIYMPAVFEAARDELAGRFSGMLILVAFVTSSYPQLLRCSDA